MEEQGEISRRRIFALGGAMAFGTAVAGVSVRDAAAKAMAPQREGMDLRDASASWSRCVGEPGYDKRVARLFEGSGS